MCAISIAIHFYLLIILTLNIKQKQFLKLYLAYYLKKNNPEASRNGNIIVPCFSKKMLDTLFSSQRQVEECKGI